MRLAFTTLAMYFAMSNANAQRDTIVDALAPAPAIANATSPSAEVRPDRPTNRPADELDASLPLLAFAFTLTLYVRSLIPL